MAAPGKMAETTSKWLDAVLVRENRVGNLLKRQIDKLAESPSAQGSATGSAAGGPMADEEPWPPMDEEVEVDVEVAEDEETQELRAHGLKRVPLSEWLEGVDDEDEYDEEHPPARRARPSAARPAPSSAHGFGPGQNPPAPPPWPPANWEPMAEEEEPVAEEPVADEVPVAEPREWDEYELFAPMPELIDELPSCAEWAFTHDQHTEHAHQYSVSMIVDEPRAWPACHHPKEPLGCNGCLCYYTISEVVGL